MYGQNNEWDYCLFIKKRMSAIRDVGEARPPTSQKYMQIGGLETLNGVCVCAEMGWQDKAIR